MVTALNRNDLDVADGRLLARVRRRKWAELEPTDVEDAHWSPSGYCLVVRTREKEFRLGVERRQYAEVADWLARHTGSSVPREPELTWDWESFQRLPLRAAAAIAFRMHRSALPHRRPGDGSDAGAPGDEDVLPIPGGEGGRPDGATLSRIRRIGDGAVAMGAFWCALGLFLAFAPGDVVWMRLLAPALSLVGAVVAAVGMSFRRRRAWAYGLVLWTVRLALAAMVLFVPLDVAQVFLRLPIGVAAFLSPLALIFDLLALLAVIFLHRELTRPEVRAAMRG